MPRPATRFLPLVLLFAAAAFPLQAAIPDAARHDARFALGYLVVTHYPGVDPTGATDSWNGLQDALDDAMDHDLVAFFPAGAYLISRKLSCYTWVDLRPDGSEGNVPQHFRELVGSRLGARPPLIKLAPGASGFDDPSHPKAMIEFNTFKDDDADGRTPRPTRAEQEALHVDECPAGYQGNAGNHYKALLAGIDFDTGGNPGAVAVCFKCAQDSALRDLHINATGSLAGCWYFSRAGSGIVNAEIVGGQYGLVAPGDNYGSAIGVTLRNQTVSAIDFRVQDVAINLVGFHIVKESGPAIIVGTGAHKSGMLSLLDGRIDLTHGGPAIDNASGKSIYVRNVSVSGMPDLVKSPGLPPVTGSGAWSRIDAYSYVNQDADPSSFAMVEGAPPAAKPAQPIAAVTQDSGPPPANLVSRHVWSTLPSFEDGAAPGQSIGVFADIRDFGATPNKDSDDDAVAINAAINAAAKAGHNRVLIPGGLFHLKSAVQLGPDTRLFGIGNAYSCLATTDWRPKEATPMILSDDDADGTAVLSDLELSYEVASVATDWFTPVHWRTGRRSIIASVRMKKSGNAGGKTETNPRPLLHFSDHGGGRVYFVCSFERPYNTTHPGYRMILAEGTTQPLSFYNINLEKGKGDYYAEFRHAANIRVWTGLKVEQMNGGDHSVIGIVACDNVAVYGVGKIVRTPDPGRGSVEVLGASRNILVTNVVPRERGQPGGDTFLDKTGADPVGVPYPEILALYQRGQLDDNAMRAEPAP